MSMSRALRFAFWYSNSYYELLIVFFNENIYLIFYTYCDWFEDSDVTRPEARDPAVFLTMWMCVLFLTAVKNDITHDISFR